MPTARRDREAALQHTNYLGRRLRVTREAGPDLLRILCFCGIVSLHAASHGGFGGHGDAAYVVDQMSRFAVPCFFILSGYFWKPGTLVFPNLAVSVAKRVLPLFTTWFLIYTVLGIVGFMGVEYQGRSALQLATALWSGGAGYHLWFLPALGVGAVVVSLAERLGRMHSFLVVLALYLLGIAIGSYSQMLFGLELPTSVYRNGVLLAPVFLLSGVVIRERSEVIAALPLAPIIFVLALGASLHLVEGAWVVQSFPDGHDYSLGTAPMALATMCLAIRWRDSSVVISAIGELTFGAFLVHALVLQAFLNWGWTSVPWIVVPATIAISLGLSFLGRKSLATARRLFRVQVGRGA